MHHKINNPLDGYKFSFKKATDSSFSTPKFVSIQLPPKSFTQPNQPTAQSNRSRAYQKSISHLTLGNFKSRDSNLIRNSSISHAFFTREGPVANDVDKSEADSHNKKRRVVHTMHKKNKKEQQLSCTPVGASSRPDSRKTQRSQVGNKRSRSERSSRNSESREEDSYLQIYKKKKREFQISRDKLQKMNMSIKNDISLLNLSGLHFSDSPKSLSSLKSKRDSKRHTDGDKNGKKGNIFFIQQHINNTSALDIINASLFPSTTRAESSSIRRKLFNNSGLNQIGEVDGLHQAQTCLNRNKLTMFRAKGKLGSNDKIGELASKIQQLTILTE